MVQSFQAYASRVNYIWNAHMRERDEAFYPGVFDTNCRDHRRLRGTRYRAQQHTTQFWIAGARYFRSDHWRVRG